jgi:DNA-binding IclR family transcriptional regulator
MLLTDPDRDDVRRAVLAAFGPVDLWDAEDLAAQLALPRTTVSQVMDELERDGILRRHPDGYAVVGAEIA